jgi:threonylcarbamoyladenosine tRNA methylthiotransferase MtaB
LDKLNEVKVGITTLGCKVNQYETASLSENLRKKGFLIVSFNTFADIYIINTCTVTSFSDFQSRQLIRRAKRNNPRAKIIVTGCYAQIAPTVLADIEGVSIVVGNNLKNFIPDLLHNEDNHSPIVLVTNISEQKYFCDMPLSKLSGRTRAFLKIQDGCNAYCSYCIVPFARGKSRSLQPDKLLTAVTKFAENGYREIVLTGIHLGAYGYDLNPPRNLTDILNEILFSCPEIRFRLSSIEPHEITDDLLQLLISNNNLCHHLHVPLQSGDDKILGLMKRNYNVSFYREQIEKITTSIKDICIGVDVMVGFPGEGDTEFNNTLRLLEDLPVAYLHVFPYSERPGTAAEKLSPKVEQKVKKKRAEILRNLGAEKRKRFASLFLGKRLNVLVEMSKDKKTGLMKGFSQNYLPVLVETSKHSYANKIVTICVNKFDDGKLYGNALSE